MICYVYDAESCWLPGFCFDFFAAPRLSVNATFGDGKFPAPVKNVKDPETWADMGMDNMGLDFCTPAIEWLLNTMHLTNEKEQSQWFEFLKQ